MQTIQENPFVSIRNDIDQVRQEIQGLRQLIQGSKPDTPRFFSIAELAKKTGTAEVTIRRGVVNGSIPSKRIGTRILIPSTYLNQ